MTFLYWLIPLGITCWLSIWVYLGYRHGGAMIMSMRAVGAVGASASAWLIWWLMGGVRYQSGWLCNRVVR